MYYNYMIYLVTVLRRSLTNSISYIDIVLH